MGLKKPQQDETIDVDVLNYNFDKLDEGTVVFGEIPESELPSTDAGSDGADAPPPPQEIPQEDLPPKADNETPAEGMF